MQNKALGLLDLPPEIWSQICKLAVECDYLVLLKPGKYRPIIVREPAITHACRRVRQECVPHIYRANHFGYMIPFSIGGCEEGEESIVEGLNALLDVTQLDIWEWGDKKKVDPVSRRSWICAGRCRLK